MGTLFFEDKTNIYIDIDILQFHIPLMYCVYETVCNVPGGGWVVWEDYSLLTVATSSPEWTQDWTQFVAARPPVETFIIPST